MEYSHILSMSETTNPTQSTATTMPQIEPRFAGFWIRFGAYFIDVILIVIVTAVVGAIIGGIIGNKNEMTVQNEMQSQIRKAVDGGKNPLTAAFEYVSLSTGQYECSKLVKVKSECEELNKAVLVKAILTTILSAIIWIGYFVGSTMMWKATLGKRLLKLTVVEGTNYQPVSSLGAVKRYSIIIAIQVVGLLALVLPFLGLLSPLLALLWLASCITVAFTAKKQGLHDMIAKTYVIYKES